MSTSRKVIADPDVIKKLDQVTINRIAAGEIIIRPANAIKEMLENSLDAKSTSIQISAKFGGLKYLQIQDNGTGIRKEDLNIVCERFTTSKLQKFEDLSTIGTFGFRGEALCSISHVAHLTIQTKTASEKCAFKATYEEGKLKGTIKPCAGNQGTQITVEDMFYNMPQRKNAYKSASEEFNRIYDVVSKYAIHNPAVGISLKKIGDKMALRTPVNSTTCENIGIVYGNDIAKELKLIELTDSMLQFKIKGYFTDVSYSSKKQNNLFFFNHRLVESKSLKQAIDLAFENYVPKGSHPFVYISLEMEPSNVDVNIHPTKHEVKFLHEHDIMANIRKAFEKELANSNQARKFYIQQLLPGASDPLLNLSEDDEEDGTQATQQKDKPTYDRYLVRSDFKEQKLEKFFGNSMPKSMMLTSSQSSSTESAEDTPKSSMESTSGSIFEQSSGSIVEKIPASNTVLDDTSESVLDPIAKSDSNPCGFDETCDTMMESILEPALDTDFEKTLERSTNSNLKTGDRSEFSRGFDESSLNETIRIASSYNPFRVGRPDGTRNETKLTSVLTLRKRIEDKCHLTLRKMISDSVFVGAIDRELMLLQYDKNLYLCNIQKLSEELIYQKVLYDFENLDRIALDPPISLKELAMLSLDTEDSGWTPEDGPKDELAERVSEILVEKSAMLREYFSLNISDDGSLESLPALLSNYMPSMCQLPLYILRLASEVDWDDEKRCFQTIARETATFYSYIPNYLEETKWKWIIEHVMYANIKQYLLPPEKFREIMLQIASLSHLYRVFERC